MFNKCPSILWLLKNLWALDGNGPISTEVKALLLPQL
jgi:hypothetical protein